MNPRYRKSKPDNVSFNTQEEMQAFIEQLKQHENTVIPRLEEQLLPRGFSSMHKDRVPEAVAGAIESLLKKIDKFCPHIESMPSMIDNHQLLPAIQTACCMHCLFDFMPLLQDSIATPECDLCDQPSIQFVEISIPIGYGVMTINVGDKCCADIFIG